MKLTTEQILEKLNTLRISAENADEVEEYGTWVEKSFRNYEFFTPRRGVEDDDQPEFTGRDKVRSIIDRHFKGASNMVEVRVDEKCWFTVIVNK